LLVKPRYRTRLGDLKNKQSTERVPSIGAPGELEKPPKSDSF
jgi:hypothetical protein